MTPRDQRGRFASPRTPQGQTALVGVALPASIVRQLYAAGVDVDELYDTAYPGDRPGRVVLWYRAAMRARTDAMLGREPGGGDASDG